MDHLDGRSMVCAWCVVAGEEVEAGREEGKGGGSEKEVDGNFVKDRGEKNKSNNFFLRY